MAYEQFQVALVIRRIERLEFSSDSSKEGEEEMQVKVTRDRVLRMEFVVRW
jgi:hypothetical protein